MAEEYVILTPLNKHGINRVERGAKVDDNDKILLVAGGMFRGIIIRREAPPGCADPRYDSDFDLQFCVYITNSSGETSQERRSLRFWFPNHQQSNEQVKAEQLHEAQKFFRAILKNDDFPKDYGNFIKKILKLLQGSYRQIQSLELEFQPVEAVAQAPPLRHEHEERSVWDIAKRGVQVESQLVQEVLEHAYPSALSAEFIAEKMNCSIEELLICLEELRILEIAQQTEDGKWRRVAHVFEKRVSSASDGSHGSVGSRGGPTIAIITALFDEKMAIDSMMEDASTYYRYKKNGESNMYTCGKIAGQDVVATKLSAIGDDRESRTASGSITTRLLGGFQSIKHVIVVGVGGGVPHYTNASAHVRLGDVVVATKAAPWDGEVDLKDPSYVYCVSVHYSRLSGEPEEYSVKKWYQTEPALEQITSDLKEQFENDPTNPPWQEHVDNASHDLKKAKGEHAFIRPSPDTDKLYMWVGEGDEGVVEVAHPDNRNYSKLHMGRIGSGRTALREPAIRADFAAQLNLKAFDQEFDSVVESISGNRIDSWTLVRGIADYTDGTRGSREWQAYASLQAAAVAKSLICGLAATENGN